MPRVLWTSIALSDLDEVLYYIAWTDRRPATGERIYGELRDRIESHAHSGLPGHTHFHAPQGWQYLRHKRWLIFYQTQQEDFVVMRVLDIARDLPRMLREP